MEMEGLETAWDSGTRPHIRALILPSVRKSTPATDPASSAPVVLAAGRRDSIDAFFTFLLQKKEKTERKKG
jgi:hypothetical protein